MLWDVFHPLKGIAIPRMRYHSNIYPETMGFDMKWATACLRVLLKIFYESANVSQVRICYECNLQGRPITKNIFCRFAIKKWRKIEILKYQTIFFRKFIQAQFIRNHCNVKVTLSNMSTKYFMLLFHWTKCNIWFCHVSSKIIHTLCSVIAKWQTLALGSTIWLKHLNIGFGHSEFELSSNDLLKQLTYACFWKIRYRGPKPNLWALYLVSLKLCL